MLDLLVQLLIIIANLTSQPVPVEDDWLTGVMIEVAEGVIETTYDCPIEASPVYDTTFENAVYIGAWCDDPMVDTGVTFQFPRDGGTVTYVVSRPGE